MMRTKAGDYYTPKEILQALVEHLGYPEGEYELLSPIYGGVIVRAKSKSTAVTRAETIIPERKARG